MAVDNGGPAFPHPGGASDYTVQVSHMGMSLRDWFAGQAMVGWCRAVGLDGAEFDKLAPETVQRAYKIADAMLAERSKP